MELVNLNDVHHVNDKIPSPNHFSHTKGKKKFGQWPALRGGSASIGHCIRTLHFLVISVMRISSFVVVTQHKSHVTWQISPLSITSCVFVNGLSFKICVFQVVSNISITFGDVSL